MKQLIKFGIIGTIGFIVDASILMIGVNQFLFSIEFSRLISFSCAVFVTWILNRTFTFSTANKFTKKIEYILYLFIQIFGALVNYGIFISLIRMNLIFKTYLIIPLAIASIIAMFFNFFMSKKFIWN